MVAQITPPWQSPYENPPKKQKTLKVKAGRQTRNEVQYSVRSRRKPPKAMDAKANRIDREEPDKPYKDALNFA